MKVLDDIWRPGIDVAICGTAVGPCAAERGHHYAQRGDGFWRLLHDSGANQRRDHGGRPDRLSWWTELAQLITADRADVR